MSIKTFLTEIARTGSRRKDKEKFQYMDVFALLHTKLKI